MILAALAEWLHWHRDDQWLDIVQFWADSRFGATFDLRRSNAGGVFVTLDAPNTHLCSWSPLPAPACGAEGGAPAGLGSSPPAGAPDPKEAA